MRLISINFLVFTFYLRAFRYARDSSSLDAGMIMRDELRFKLHELIERLLNIFSRHSPPPSHFSNAVYCYVCTTITTTLDLHDVRDWFNKNEKMIVQDGRTKCFTFKDINTQLSPFIFTFDTNYSADKI